MIATKTKGDNGNKAGGMSAATKRRGQGEGKTKAPRKGRLAGLIPKLEHETVTISPPKLTTWRFRIIGTAPYVQNKFSKKAKEILHNRHEAGSTNAKGEKREGKDFDALYNGAMHKMADGSHGIPAPAFRNGMISACRMAGFKMTHAKLSVFIEADGYDTEDGTPLVRITKGKPRYHESYVRNATGVVDLRARPMWDIGWQADVRVRYDEDQFTLADVGNLLTRVGLQVGIGEGRPDSRSSAGMGWGMFELAGEAQKDGVK